MKVKEKTIKIKELKQNLESNLTVLFTENRDVSFKLANSEFKDEKIDLLISKLNELKYTNRFNTIIFNEVFNLMLEIDYSISYKVFIINEEETEVYVNFKKEK